MDTKYIHSAGGMAQEVELLPSKHEALSSNTCTAEKEKETKYINHIHPHLFHCAQPLPLVPFQRKDLFVQGFLPWYFRSNIQQLIVQCIILYSYINRFFKIFSFSFSVSLTPPIAPSNRLTMQLFSLSLFVEQYMVLYIHFS
jgi:hypothetical protein